MCIMESLPYQKKGKQDKPKVRSIYQPSSWEVALEFTVAPFDRELVDPVT